MDLTPLPFRAGLVDYHKRAAVVRLLVERGARIDIRDTVYEGTPLGWAMHAGRAEIADYLRSQAARVQGP